jgi:hypothetical protein
MLLFKAIIEVFFCERWVDQSTHSIDIVSNDTSNKNNIMDINNGG